MIIGSANELNTAAFLLNKSIIEMNKFVKFLGGSEKSVYGLAQEIFLLHLCILLENIQIC